MQYVANPYHVPDFFMSSPIFCVILILHDRVLTLYGLPDISASSILSRKQGDGPEKTADCCSSWCPLGITGRNSLALSV